MAAVIGNLMPDIETMTFPLVMSSVSAGDPHYDSVNLVIGIASIGGSFVRGIIDDDSQAVTGGLITGYVTDFYHRFHLIPDTIDFDFIIGDTEESFVLWNAYFTPKICTAINQVNGDEFVLTGLSPPFTLNGLEQTTYTVAPLVEGSANFVSTISFDFGVDDTYVIETILGIRVFLFKWWPKQPMVEYLEWLTDVIIAKDGSEQRISVRRTPRQGFIFTVYFETEKEQSELEALLYKWQKRLWGVPVFFDNIPLSSPTSSLDTSIFLDTTDSDFRDNSLIVIWEGEENRKVLRVDTVLSDRLLLSETVGAVFAAGTDVLPVRRAHINRVVRSKEAPDGHSSVEFSFIVRDNLLLTDYSAATTYLSLPVLTKASVVGDNQEKGTDGDVSIIDFDTGDFLIYSDSDFNKITQSHVFKNYTRTQAWNYRLLLHHLLGQLNVVWVPTFKNDMKLVQDIGAADEDIRIENIGLADNMGLNDLRTHIAFIFSDGTMLLREITGITEISSTEERITIDSSLGQSISMGETIISFLDKCRMSSDVVKIDWEHQGWNISKINWLKVKA